MSYVPGARFKTWYQGGAVTWTSSKGTKTRLPVVASAEEYNIPSSVGFTSTQAGNLTYTFTTALSGQMTVRAVSVQPSVLYTGQVTQDTRQDFSIRNRGVARVEVVIPPTNGGLAIARFEMVDHENGASVGNDLDLYVYKGLNRIAASPEAGTSAALINIFNASGTYVAYIHGFKVPSNTTTYRLHVFVQVVPAAPAATSNLQATLDLLGSASTSNGAISSGNVISGVPVPVTLQLKPSTALRRNRRYMGLVLYFWQDNESGSSSPVLKPIASTVVTASSF
jgi:hypothetical protein